jgi:glycosyltransferase involved in cell wall biosynthesis
MAALWLLWKHRSNSFFHAADIRSAIVLRIFKSLTGHPYAVTIHGSEVSKLGKRGIDGALASWSYRSAAVIFANSHATKQLFLKNVPCSVPVRVTHLGVDSQWFQPSPEYFEHEVLALIDGKADIVSAVGRVEDRKGHLYTLEAMKRLAAEPGFEKIVYVIAGAVIDQAYAANLERRASSLGLRCVMTGPLSAGDLRRLYHRSICHMLTALTVEGKIEGFGLVVLEAAAQGCPTIATRVGGIVEVVRDGETGLLCPEGDSAAITAALHKMVLNASYRQRVSGNCLRHAAEFTWNRCVEVTYGGVVSGFSA